MISFAKSFRFLLAFFAFNAVFKNTARWEFRGNSAADFTVVDTGTTPTGDTEACCWLRAPVCLALKESL